jgi:hypothetical protein
MLPYLSSKASIPSFFFRKLGTTLRRTPTHPPPLVYQDPAGGAKKFSPGGRRLRQANPSGTQTQDF